MLLDPKVAICVQKDLTPLIISNSGVSKKIYDGQADPMVESLEISIAAKDLDLVTCCPVLSETHS